MLKILVSSYDGRKLIHKDFYRKLATVPRKADCTNSCLNPDRNIGIAKFKRVRMIEDVEKGYTETKEKRASSKVSNTASVEVFCIPLGLIVTALQMYHIDFFH